MEPIKKPVQDRLLELEQWLDDYYSGQFIMRNKMRYTEEDIDPLEELIDEYDNELDRLDV